jgi:hypothetical protein
MNDDEPSAAAADPVIRSKMLELRQEHYDLDASIQLMVARLKRKKLALRDQISLLEDQILPDIIA